MATLALAVLSCEASATLEIASRHEPRCLRVSFLLQYYKLGSFETVNGHHSERRAEHTGQFFLCISTEDPPVA